MTDATFESALRALYSPLHQSTTKEAIAKSAARRTRTVDDMRKYLERAGIQVPRHTRVLHITGTKGKGSTACFCENILRKRYGLSTGLFTSPHLVHIRERIRVNGCPITPDSFCRAYWNVRQRLEDHETEDVANDLPTLPGYFRMLTLMALYAFSNYTPKVDVIILEVGMGGRYDATNILNHSDYSTRCGVTQLDLDHVRVLGSTVEQIAWEKGGIFACDKVASPASPRPQNCLDSTVTSSSSPSNSTFFALASNSKSSLDILARCAMIEGQGGELLLVGANKNSRLPAHCHIGLPGSHQRGNAELAAALCESLMVDATLDKGVNEMYDAVANASWPGRCQSVRLSPSLVLRLDGAHTVNSFTTGFNWFRSQTPEHTRKILVFNCHHERNPVELLRILDCRVFAAAYFTKANSERPSAVAKLSAKELLSNAGLEYYEDIETSEGTWQDTLAVLWKHQLRDAKHESLTKSKYSCSQLLPELTNESTMMTDVLVCGSLYLVGSMLEAANWSESDDLGKVV